MRTILLLTVLVVAGCSGSSAPPLFEVGAAATISGTITEINLEPMAVDGDGVITLEIAKAALDMLEVDDEGLDKMDRHIVLTIIEKFGGGPIGLDSLSAAVSEEKDTLEDVYEPFLIQRGYIKRTPRGRVATDRAYHHFGLTMTESQAQGQKKLF